MLHCHILVQAPWKGTSCCHRLHWRAMILRTWCAISSRHTMQWHDCPGPTAGAGKSATQNATTPCNVEPEGDIHGSVKRFRCGIWRCWMSYEIDHDHAALPYLKITMSTFTANQIHKLHPCHSMSMYCISASFVGHHFQRYSWKDASRSPCRFSKSLIFRITVCFLSFPSHISANFLETMIFFHYFQSTLPCFNRFPTWHPWTCLPRNKTDRHISCSSHRSLQWARLEIPATEHSQCIGPGEKTTHHQWQWKGLISGVWLLSITFTWVKTCGNI